MKKLRLYRLRRGLTQTQMAALLGIHFTMLSRLERGWFTRCPNQPELGRKLEAYFGETFDELMTDATPDMEPLESAPRAS